MHNSISIWKQAEHCLQALPVSNMTYAQSGTKDGLGTGTVRTGAAAVSL